MIFLIILGVILLLINSTVGAIYFSGILFAITIGLIIKEEKNKGNKRVNRVKRAKRTREVNAGNELKALCETDRKKFWVYFSCAIIVIITVIFCGVVIVVYLG